jgi:hypothetical protein
MVSGKGIIVPNRDHMYFVGLEQNNNSPMVIAVPKLVAGLRIVGLVLRKHELGRILASRVVFVKRHDIAFEDECKSNIGVFTESQLSKELTNLNALMLNDIWQFGKGNLLL